MAAMLHRLPLRRNALLLAQRNGGSSSSRTTGLCASSTAAAVAVVGSAERVSFGGARSLVRLLSTSNRSDGVVPIGKSLASSALLRPSDNDAWQVIRPEHFKHVEAPTHWDQQLQQLQDRIGIQFRNLTHLKCALTHHGSFQHNQIPAAVSAYRLSNRSLEFLGDSILGMSVSSYLFQVQPLHQEGQLTLAKAALVNNQTLSKICVHDLKLHDLILVAADYSLRMQSGKTMYTKGRATIQAGAVESLIAAVYLDQGLDVAVDFVNTQILPHAIKYATEETPVEPVSELQNLLQGNGYGQPVYKHLPAPVNSKAFQVKLIVKGEPIVTTSGTSYKEARVKAADAGLRYFQRLVELDKAVPRA